MAKVHYCWRCQMDIPMLEEHEWKEISPHFQENLQEVRALYQKFTGFDETNPVAIAHHRLAYFGPSCEACGRLYRTPQARLCMNCGNARQIIAMG
jgi:uncharacterized OB-fold protein